MKAKRRLRLPRKQKEEPYPNPATVSSVADMGKYSKREFAEPAAWFEENEPPSAYGPRKFCTREYQLKHRDELELWRFTVEYLKRQPRWHLRPKATWRDYALEAAEGSAHEGLRYLEKLANEGDDLAMEALASRTLEMVKVLNRFALSESQRARLIPFARRCLAWPALKARRKVFSDDHDEIIRVLQVGKDTIVGKDSQSRFNPQRRFGKVTMEIIDRIESFRTARPAHWKFLFHLQLPSPNWAREARKLPPFGRESKVRWWSVVEKVLKDDYSHPLTAEAYNKLVKAPSHEDRKASIFVNKIKDEFDTLAGIHRRGQ